ncbi:protein transport protein sec31-like isoform X5 [Canis lupus familiaris]|uniref:protein transport protein sec31-like isoform X5 n=1 Tax=Canis lupus familiaris TaxID=9615 RepID=UPI0018F29B0C|nr:protein transport protein sec31-like isoform X5 [Canis lupus familiaris]XP_038428905.1 protein transport protein sec31-like isoform X4 [Canis lupus familiaris]
MVQKIPFISPPLQRRVKLLPPPGNTVPSIPRARPAPVFHPPLRPLPLHLLGPFRLRLLTLRRGEARGAPLHWVRGSEDGPRTGSPFPGAGAADETAAGTAPRATEGTTVVPDPLLQHRPRQWASCAPPPPGPAEDVPASGPAWTDTAPQRRQRRGQREKEGHSPASAPSPHSTGSSHPPVARVRKRGLTSSFPIGRARSHVAGSIRPRGALTPPAACERFTCRQKLREDFTWRRPPELRRRRCQSPLAQALSDPVSGDSADPSDPSYHVLGKIKQPHGKTMYGCCDQQLQIRSQLQPAPTARCVIEWAFRRFQSSAMD